jgi:L-arabinose isomerase
MLMNSRNASKKLLSAAPGKTYLRVGLCGVGLAAYWPQFVGLKERLGGYLSDVEARLNRPGIKIVNLGLIDNSNQSIEAGHTLRRADVDIIFLYVTTYVLSATVLPLVRRAKVPVIILNLQPESRIDYASFNRLGSRRKMTEEWLAYCTACPVPEIANVFRRAGIDFHQVTGFLGDYACWDEIGAWLDAAMVIAQLEHNTLGLVGHYYSGMLDVYSDLTLCSAIFGSQIEILEADELAMIRNDVEEHIANERLDLFKDMFEIQADCKQEDLAEAARTSVALDRLVERYGLGSIAYYHKGIGNVANERAFESIILGTSFLTARGVPVAGEYDVKNVLAMKIFAILGAGGSFSELYAIDFEDDVVLLGHDGPGHVAIGQGKTKVRPLDVYHGKVGRGISVEMSVQHGPVTLLSVAEDPLRGFKLVVAEGESVPGPILEIGNTNSRYRFPIGARRFTSEWSAAGPAHHCAVGLGHLAGTIEKVGALLRIPVVCVC